MKFSHSFLEGIACTWLYQVPLAGECPSQVFDLWSMRWGCESELGHPEDLEEKLCCSEHVSSALPSTQMWWLLLQVSCIDDWHMDQQEKTVDISL